MKLALCGGTPAEGRKTNKPPQTMKKHLWILVRGGDYVTSP